MNLRRVLRILGLVLYVLSAAQFAPLAWCLFPPDWNAASGLLTGVAASALLGLARYRMQGHTENKPSKPDDLTFIVYRPAPA